MKPPDPRHVLFNAFGLIIRTDAYGVRIINFYGHTCYFLTIKLGLRRAYIIIETQRSQTVYALLDGKPRKQVSTLN